MKSALIKFLILVSLTTLILPRIRAATDTNEVWISARTNLLGTGLVFGNGMITNPFYGDFDAVIGSLTTNTTIHLLPGVHFTKGFAWNPGEVQFAAYQRIIGAGIDTTTLRRDTNFNYDTGEMQGVLFSLADGVEVRDMTIDANARGTEAFKQNGICLSGSYCKVHRVRLINNSGNWPNGEECFSIAMGGKQSVVSEAEVTLVRGNYHTAIANIGEGSVVERCSVYLPAMTNGSGYQAYGGQLANTSFLNNYCEGGGRGYYAEYFNGLSTTNLKIINNTFKNVSLGIFIWLWGGHVDGLSIRDNVIEISTNAVGGVLLDNYDTTGNYICRNVDISGNTIRPFTNCVVPPGTFAIATLGIQTNFMGVKIVGNTVDRSMMLDANLNGQSVVLADNMDTNGIPLHFRKVGAGSPSTITLNKTDGTVIVTSVSTTNLTLPTAAGFTAKEILVSNYKASRLTINPESGETIAPLGSFVLTTNASVKLFSDGISIWSKESLNP